MSKPLYKKWWVIVIAVFVTLVILGELLPDPENKSGVIDDADAIEEPEEREEDINARRLNDSIKYVDAIQKDILYYDSLSKVDMKEDAKDVVTLLKLYQNMHLSKFENDLAQNKEISKLLNKERANLKKTLKRQYNVARQSFTEVMSESLFDSNIEVIYDKRNREVIFIGGTFANNANKTAYKDELSKQNIPSLYRIKNLTFKWYSGDKGNTWEYTKVPNDDDIISM